MARISSRITTVIRIVRKREAAQKRFERVKLGDEELTNVLHFKYLGVMKSGDGDPWSL